MPAIYTWAENTTRAGDVFTGGSHSDDPEDYGDDVTLFADSEDEARTLAKQIVENVRCSDFQRREAANVLAYVN